MGVFFAMDVVGSNPNDPSFFLRLPHLWPEFVIPIVCFYTVLAVWVIQKVKEARTSHIHQVDHSPPDSGTPGQQAGSSTENQPPAPSQSGTASPSKPRFFGCFCVGS